MDIRLCLHQSLTTSDDGGSRGADVVDDEKMLSGEVGDGVLALSVVIEC